MIKSERAAPAGGPWISFRFRNGAVRQDEPTTTRCVVTLSIYDNLPVPRNPVVRTNPRRTRILRKLREAEARALMLGLRLAERDHELRVIHRASRRHQATLAVITARLAHIERHRDLRRDHDELRRALETIRRRLRHDRRRESRS
jgi:hypothetical protein